MIDQILGDIIADR